MRSFASRLAESRRGPAVATGQQVAGAPGTGAPGTGAPGTGAPGTGAPGTGLAVIGAGFGRTGTMSLKRALEWLGLGPCYHATEITNNRSHARLWRAADAGKPVDWQRLFARYRAAVDWPACDYYRELMGVFPGAKVILTVRDPADWYDSISSTLYRLKVATDNYFSAGLGEIKSGRAPVPRYENPIWARTFAGRFADRQYAIGVFERHNAEVVRCVPAGRLLVYQVSEGWRTLCDFLGRPVPDQPFPHANTAQSFREYNRERLRYA